MKAGFGNIKLPIIICYFTGTYNTLKAVKLVAEEFGKNEVETELYEIRSTNKEMPDFDAYDYIGFAYPIHGFNAPYYVLDFCKKIQKSEKKRSYPICLHRLRERGTRHGRKCTGQSGKEFS